MVCMHARVHRCGWNIVNVTIPHLTPPYSTHPTPPQCVYTGLTREGCDEVLEKASPGAYLLRESMTRPGQLVVSFR